ncbi:MAG TPA: PDZ domain-containing protein, partial [Gemmatimonadales bacterium]|nr:PDZ domain-containing protein [Gemmatimonadales bacterium]
VRAGSPAEAAGLKGGDVIVRMGGVDIADLQGMTDVLRAHKAGDTVDLIFVRDGQRITTRVTFGRRGS